MGTPRHLCESYTVGKAFRQVGRGSLKLQLPGGQICLVIWQENTGGFDLQSSKEAFERKHLSASTTKIKADRKSVSMIFLLCPICFAHRCRVLYKPISDLWGCRHCHGISYKHYEKIDVANTLASDVSSEHDTQRHADIRHSFKPDRRMQRIRFPKYKDLWLKEYHVYKVLSRQLAEIDS